MNVLVIGAAGKVGSIVRPALEREHRCRYYDLKPVPGAEDRTTVGDVNDEATLAAALDGHDAVIYLAMGAVMEDNRQNVGDVDAAFGVNLRDWYRTLHLGLDKGIRRWVYASSLSVYHSFITRDGRIDESVPADAWHPYGLSKRLAEHVCDAAAQQYPDAVILALRLVHPHTVAERQQMRRDQQHHERHRLAQAPQDVARLFLAALRLDRPGCHVVQTTGDLTGERLPNTRAAALLGWTPRESLDA